MAIVIDVAPNPTQDRCFFTLIRKLHENLDLSNFSNDRKNGHPIFTSAETDAEYQAMCDSQKKNKQKLGKMKIETGNDSAFHIFIGGKAKVYVKKNICLSSKDIEKTIVKHKGISNTSQLTYESFLECLTEDKCQYVTNTQFRIEKLHIYTSEATKKATNMADAKRFYMSKYFSSPFSHPDVKLYKDMKSKNEDVFNFVESKPPHFIPKYFFDKFVENVVTKKQYIKAEGEIYNDYDKTSENDDRLYDILKSSFQNCNIRKDYDTYSGEDEEIEIITEEYIDNIITEGISPSEEELENEKKKLLEKKKKNDTFTNPPIFEKNTDGVWIDLSNSDDLLENVTKSKKKRTIQIINDTNNTSESRQSKKKCISQVTNDALEPRPGCSFWNSRDIQFHDIYRKYDKQNQLSSIPIINPIITSEPDSDNDSVDETSKMINKEKNKRTYERRKRIEEIDKEFGFHVLDATERDSYSDSDS